MARNEPTKRAALLSALAQEFHERSREMGVDVVELKPEVVRERLTGDAKATKYEVAQRLVAEGFPQLEALVPQKPKVPALWLTARERYWLHMFDALASAAAAQSARPEPRSEPAAPAID